MMATTRPQTVVGRVRRSVFESATLLTHRTNPIDIGGLWSYDSVVTTSTYRGATDTGKTTLKGRPPSRSWNDLVNLYALLIISIPILIGSDVYANSLGINLYGVSYHFLNHNQSRDRLNEFNPGLGLRASFGTDSTNIFFIEGGSFKDTFNNQAKYLSIGYLIRVWKQLRVGLNAAVYTTRSINRGEAFLSTEIQRSQPLHDTWSICYNSPIPAVVGRVRLRTRHPP